MYGFGTNSFSSLPVTKKHDANRIYKILEKYPFGINLKESKFKAISERCVWHFQKGGTLIPAGNI
jgi:hypothetical protein